MIEPDNDTAILFFLYVVAGFATAIPVFLALAGPPGGAGVFLTEFVSLFGSILLVASAWISLSNRRFAARLALVGTAGICSFYLPAIAGLVRAHLSDQELSLSVLRWIPTTRPLTMETPPAGMSLSQDQMRQIEQTGIRGRLSVYTANGKYGSGKHSRVTLIMREPVVKRIVLKEPDAVDVVSVQYGADWKMFPPNAPTLNRTIRIEPEFGDPAQSNVLVQLADGSGRGFDVWWPKK